MSDFLAAIMPTTYIPDDDERADCPTWCQSHQLDMDAPAVAHFATVTAGEVTLELEHISGVPAGRHDPPGNGAVFLPSFAWINGQDPRDYIAALSAAAELLDGGAS